ncbi:MAG TPA: hypothetical protein VGF45_15580 [Polyangia bacterium]
MYTRAADTIQLGNLVALAFDRAAEMTSNQQRAAELASFTVTQWLRRTGQLHLLRQLAAEIDSAAPRASQAMRRTAAVENGETAAPRLAA